jgi:hypothetical protein
LAEHIHGKDEVNGSIPFEGSLFIRLDKLWPGRTAVASRHPVEGFLGSVPLGGSVMGAGRWRLSPLAVSSFFFGAAWRKTRAPISF